MEVYLYLRWWTHGSLDHVFLDTIFKLGLLLTNGLVPEAIQLWVEWRPPLATRLRELSHDWSERSK